MRRTNTILALGLGGLLLTGLAACGEKKTDQAASNATPAASTQQAAAPAAPAGGKTLDNVKAYGKLKCGVNTGLAGFGAPDDKGNWAGLDIDLCRAIAAAVFGDATKVEYKPLNAEQRFTALQ